ncbi:MAG TPA: phage holin family protein [Patescibacteria group bacterium]|nr:phage holin family protein [Patescibacteria group bacterium]
MKRIIRGIIFSALSLYLTSLVIRGFSIRYDLKPFLLATLILAVVYYLIVPLSKLILLPLNILTLGLVSVVVYIFLFNYVIHYFGFISIHSWTFEGFTFSGLVIPKIQLNYLSTLISSALLYSTIINVFELVI